MSASVWAAAACLTAAVLVCWWPYPAGRLRQRLVLGQHPRIVGQHGPRGWTSWRPFLAALFHRSPRQAVSAVTVLTALAGAAVGGPVAAIAGGAYGALAAGGLLRRRSARAEHARRNRQLDDLCALAADLRAGLPVPVVNSSASGARTAATPAGAARATDRVVALASAARRLAEQTGAPLAELIERIEADARAMDRATATAAAQAAGARATAWLLSGLPLAGIALGYGIGTDPLRVLLHTPIGAGCAAGAIVLQLAGLVWADRLSRIGRPA